MDQAELRETFEAYDRDHNGVIDKGEFGELCAALGAGFEQEEIDIGFSEIDSDHNGTIEFDEFAAWWTER